MLRAIGTIAVLAVVVIAATLLYTGRTLARAVGGALLTPPNGTAPPPSNGSALRPQKSNSSGV